MRAAFVSKYGGPEVLKIQETPVPVPKPEQVLIRVRCIGLNFADIFGRFGVYPGTPKPPFIPGLELSGEVTETGSAVTRFAPGDRVMGYSRLGSHAEFVAVHQHYVSRMPASMTFDQGASFLVTMLSAFHGLVRLANLHSDEKLLVHAAAGGVGLAAIQIGKHLGAEVFATSGTTAKVTLARSFGADHSINYSTADFDEEIRALTGNYGVDVVMDSVGGEVYKKSWNLLAPMGRYVLFGVSAVTGKGALSRLKAANIFASMRPIFPPNLMSANKGIFGFNLGLIHGREKYFEEAVATLLSWYEQGKLRILVGKVFPFEQIVDAHEFLQMRHSVGKVVVRV
jgi:NADPH:quinone reductase-like Zn-dependent oxidoreductase